MGLITGGIDLPARTPVTCSVQIMLSALGGPLKEGVNSPLTLNFANSGVERISVPVESPEAMGPPVVGAGRGMNMPAGQ